MAAQLKLTQLFKTKSFLIKLEMYNLIGRILGLLFKNYRFECSNLRTTRGLYDY